MPSELTDPFVYDLDRLRAAASEPVVKRGIAYFKENRVTELDGDGAHVWARVDGSSSDTPYMVELGLDDEGELLVQCDCPFDGEPVCKHAVAVLLSYGAAGAIDSPALAGAAAEAMEERVRRARIEVRVQHVAGEPWFGTWTAASLASAAAELLIAREHGAGAVELLASCLLSAAAAKAGLARPPPAEEAAVWVYAEAVPGAARTAEQAAAVVRAVSLRNAPAIPDALLAEVLADARSLLGAPG